MKLSIQNSGDPTFFDDIKNDLQKKFLNAPELNIETIDRIKHDLVVKEYSQAEIRSKVRFLELDKIVYEKDVKISYKLKSVFTSLHSVGGTLLVKIISDGSACRILIGVKALISVENKKNILKGALEGNF